MLESATFTVGGKPLCFASEVRTTENLPVAMQYWTAHVARDLLRLGAFFRAAGIMCQVPGVDEYKFILCDDSDDDRPDGDEDPEIWLGRVPDDTVLDVLAECLRRLEAEHLMDQVPGAGDHESTKLSGECSAHLSYWAGMEHGLLNVVAECLDRLIVRPGMAEVDDAAQPTWWQDWWRRM